MPPRSSRAFTIAYDAKRAFANPTGLGNYSRFVIEAVSRLAPELDLVLYTPTKSPGRMDAEVLARPNVRVQAAALPGLLPGLLRGPLRGPLAAAWRGGLVSARLARDGVDVYHGLSHELPLGLGLAKVPGVVTVHDMLPFSHPQFFPRVDAAVYRAKFRSAVRRATRVVAVSGRTRQEIVDRLDVDPAKVAVVYQGCQERFFHPPEGQELEALREDLQRRYDLPERFILSVGAIIERKNLAGLVRAFAQLPKPAAGPEIGLVVVGEGGAYAEQVRALVAELGLGPRVRFLGRLEADVLPGLYRLAEVLAYPSFFEGFGIPIVEALAAGTPVVTSHGSCFSEPGGPGALYADPADPADLARALERVLYETGEPGLREELARLGHAHVQQFRPEATTPGLVDIYRRAAAGS